MSGGHGNSLSQIGFRGRNDDGNETAATWIKGKNQNFSQRPDRNFRVRFVVHSVTTPPGPFHLYYSYNGGGWLAAVGGASKINAALSTYYTDEDVTTQQVGTGDFLADFGGMTNNSYISAYYEALLNNETEVEFCLTLRGSALNDGDTISLRGQFGAAPFGGGWLEIPVITVDKPPRRRRLIIIQ
jgi:hypothetical protein